MKIALSQHRRRALLLATVALAAAPMAQASKMQPQDARDLARYTTTTLAQINGLRDTMTVDAVRKLLPDLSFNADDPADQILVWHTLALNVTAIDHTSDVENGVQQNQEQFGPHRTSYALAIVHIAMFEVANAYAPAGARYKSWIGQTAGTPPAAPPAGASEAAAIVGAAYATLAHLYPNLKPKLMTEMQKATQGIGTGAAEGQSYGEAIGNQVVGLRNDDNIVEISWGAGFTPKQAPNSDGSYPAGQWQIDPVSQIKTALGATWPQIAPFVLTSGSQFRSTIPNPPPPSLGNPVYRQAAEEVLQQGADQRRNQDRVDPGLAHYYHAKFWAYDATAGLCAPARLYNQISDQVLKDYAATLAPHLHAANRSAAAAEIGRFYALVNATMADAGVAAWDAKYAFQYWRPVTGIRFEQELEKAPGAPVNPIFQHREVWYPLGAQSTNSVAGYNITPPFPSYPSGHAVFGGALFEVLRELVPQDHGFKFWSDEFNGPHKLGTNIDAYNFERCKDGDNSPLFCRAFTFTSFTDAENDNANSRVWMGVHWGFDATAGNKLGETVGNYVNTNAFTKLP